MADESNRPTPDPLGSSGSSSSGAAERGFRSSSRERPLPQTARYLLAAIVDSSQDSIVAVDFDGAITNWNKAAESLFGFRAEEVVGRLLAMLPLAEDLAQSLRHIDRVKHSQKVEKLDAVVNKGGRELHLEVVMSPIQDDAGQVVGVLAVVRDVTAPAAAAEMARESEERHRLIVEAARDYAILTADAEGRIESWSPGAEAVFGWTAQEAVGEPLEITFTDEDRADGVPQREREDAVKHGSTPDVRWHRRKDGSRVFIDGTSRVLLNAAGDVRGFLKIGQDRTERKRSEEALRESEGRLRVALMAGQTGTWLWRLATDEQILDESLERLVGQPKGSSPMTIETFLGLAHEEDRPRLREAFERVVGGVAENDAMDVEFRVRRDDGSLRWLRDQGRVFRDESGRPIFMAGACTDITERKRMEEALQDADRRKDEFLAMLGHELRNPLAAVVAGIKVALSPKVQEAKRLQMLALVDEQVAHVRRLVDDVMDVARMTEGRIQVIPEPVSLQQVLQQAIGIVEFMIREKGCELHLDMPGDAIRLRADPVRLAQVFMNLLTNAAKYGGESRRIAVSAAVEGSEAVVRVRDWGVGIAPELLPRVFDLFVQSSHTLDRSDGGLGMGLSVVRRLVELHGGTVEAHSEGPGRGSEFIVRLPLPEGA